MAWIESHQDLRTNPKAKRLARQLDVPLAQAIGHLHMLWWWALDHAFEGSLARFDAYDIADAAGWDGDEPAFIRALIECGGASRSGFIDGDPVDNSTWRLHDWHEFTDAMRAKREASEKAHHTRWHEKRGVQADGCRFCDAPALRPQSDSSAGAPDPQMHPRAPNAGAGADAPEPEPEPGPTGTNQGPAREPDPGDPGHPPTGEPKFPPPPHQPDDHDSELADPRRWDTAWSDVCRYVRAWAPQDPDRPAPEDTFGPRTVAALRTIGGVSRIRREDRPDAAKYAFRDAWQEATIDA